jgi:hypothetical protein
MTHSPNLAKLAEIEQMALAEREVNHAALEACAIARSLLAEVGLAETKAAREGWMRACVFYKDIDAEGDAEVIAEMDSRWPLPPAPKGGV